MPELKLVIDEDYAHILDSVPTPSSLKLSLRQHPSYINAKVKNAKGSSKVICKFYRDKVFVGYSAMYCKTIFFVNIFRSNGGPIFFDGLNDVDREVLLRMWLREFSSFSRRRFLLWAPDQDPLVSLRTKPIFLTIPKSVRLTLIMDLQGGLDSVLAKMSRGWRYSIRRALREGVAAKNRNSYEAFRVFEDSYRDMQQRKNFKGSITLIREIYYEFIRNNAIAFIIEVESSEGSHLGSALFVGHGDTITYLAGVTTNQGRQRSIGSYVLYHGIQRSIELKFKYLDLGGIFTGREQENRFKRASGAEEHKMPPQILCLNMGGGKR